VIPACTPAGDDASAGDEQDVVGGSGKIESGIVYMFSSDDENAMPACIGTLLGDKKVAITLKSCAKQGMIVGRADDKDGKGKRTKITSIIAPERKDAEIVLVLLEKDVGGRPAKITHAPLRDGYSVQGVAAMKDRGILNILDPDKGEASSVDATMISETETHGSVVPKKGSKICASDLGAPVCSTLSKKVPIPLTDIELTGTCGLAGLVVGPETGELSDDPASCSAEPWKVVELAPYIPFLKEHAPGAFTPVKIGFGPLKKEFALDGLWGYKSAGDVTDCSVTTSEMAPAIAGAATKIEAKAALGNMQDKATLFGRVGIAPKSSPEKIRWLAASTDAKKGAAEAMFAGDVAADAEGEYVVSFRASANGGETWTQCKSDKPLVLEITAPPPSSENKPTPETPKPDETPSTPKSSETTPTSDPAEGPATETSDSSDSSGADDDSTSSEKDSEDPAPATGKKKKAGSSEGCAMTSHATPSGALPFLGLAVAIAAGLRRRRR
jgi:MYXO-CTERM domain-containing protein